VIKTRNLVNALLAKNHLVVNPLVIKVKLVVMENQAAASLVAEKLHVVELKKLVVRKK
jgi:hypothetical protein